MHKIIWSPESYSAAYIDDFIVGSHTFDDYLQHVRNILECLDRYHLTLHLAKCEWFQPHVDFIGHEIGGGIM